MSRQKELKFRIVKLEDQLSLHTDGKKSSNLHTGKMTVEIMVNNSECSAKIVLTTSGTIETTPLVTIRSEISKWLKTNQHAIAENLRVIEDGVRNGTLDCLNPGGEKCEQKAN